MDHRRPRGGRSGTTVHPPLTVSEYIIRNLLDAERFEAIRRRRTIRANSPRRAIPQEERANAGRSRWRHAPNRTLALPGWDLMYVHLTGEKQDHAKFLQVFGPYHRPEYMVPHVRLVAFLRPFEHLYCIADRSQWGEDFAKETRLRGRRVDSFFYIWHNTESF